MCNTCGCGNSEESHIHSHDHHHHDHDHDHHHDHEHSHDHDHSHDHSDDDKQAHNRDGRVTLSVEREILETNNRLAERNRGYFEARNIFAVNLVSSPGSGKTTLLETTLREMKDKLKFCVIEGDQQTRNDADRIEATGVRVVQVNTGSGCHLDAAMVSRAVKELDPEPDSILFIENVGNLICPAMFDLGEEARVVVMSVTEGEDKPLKYPDIFRSARVCIINKTDLLPYLDFNVARAIDNGLHVNGRLRFIELSARTGEGMDEWFRWLSANSR